MPATTVLYHADCVSKARDAVLQIALEHARHERVREDEILAFAKPLQMTTGAMCFVRKNPACEFQGQDECLERILAGDPL